MEKAYLINWENNEASRVVIAESVKDAAETLENWLMENERSWPISSIECLGEAIK